MKWRWHFCTLKQKETVKRIKVSQTWGKDHSQGDFVIKVEGQPYWHPGSCKTEWYDSLKSAKNFLESSDCLGVQSCLGPDSTAPKKWKMFAVVLKRTKNMHCVYYHES